MTATTFVVPLDGSGAAERGVPVVCTLAERVDGRVILVSAPYKGVLRPCEYLDEIARRCWVPVESRVDVAYLPADAITSVVEEADDRVLCMTSHGRGGLRWSIVGSTAEEVIRRSDRPVVLVGRHCRDDFMVHGTQLLAGVDGLECSRQLAPVTKQWAERLGLGIDAAIVVHPLDVESAEHSDLILDPIIAAFGGPAQVRAHLLRGSYDAGVLADLADDLPAALIAMASQADTGLSRIVLGSVTMALLNLAPCPLLVTHRTD